MATAPVARSEVASFDGPPPPASLRSRFPRVVGYLEALPAGVHSYPECVARSGILQTFLDARPPATGDVDPWIAALLRPSPLRYVPEAVLNAALLAMGDAAGLTDAQYLDWNRATNRQLYRGLLYRALMAIFSPAMLLERAPARWESFHVGTKLAVEVRGAKEAAAVLTFPAQLFGPLLLQGYATAFAAALEHARGHDARVELGVATPTSARFVARWG